jgi:uncharacterized alkaline shock family protein YloU
MDTRTGPARPEAADTAAAPAARHAPPAGKIEVSAQAIATVAGRAVAACYGVVGIAARRTRFGRLEVLPPEEYGRGVEVRFISDHVAIELYVVMEYGLRIAEVARNVIRDVKYAVEHTIGLPVVEVNVNVQGLRVEERLEADQ